MKKLVLIAVLLSGSIVSAGDSGRCSQTESPIKGSFVLPSNELMENASQVHEATYEGGIRYHLFEELCAMSRVNRKHNGTTALHEAVAAGILDNVITLLYCSANPNVRNTEGQTPLMIARAFKHGEIEKLLKRFGALEEPLKPLN